jgi:hypothetical protein
MWCNVVNCSKESVAGLYLKRIDEHYFERAYSMNREKAPRTKVKAPKKPAVRASITFPPALYQSLEEIAHQKKVSLAWVVRDAAERYVSESFDAPRLGKR